MAPQGQGTSHRASQNSPRQGWWGRAQQRVFQGWQSFKGFLLSVCSSRERPLHFIKLQLPLLSGGQLPLLLGALLPLHCSSLQLPLHLISRQLPLHNIRLQLPLHLISLQLPLHLISLPMHSI